MDNSVKKILLDTIPSNSESFEKGAVAEAKTAAALFQMRNAPNNVQKGQAQISPQTDSSLAGQNGDKKVEISENQKIRPRFPGKKESL